MSGWSSLRNDSDWRSVLSVTSTVFSKVIAKLQTNLAVNHLAIAVNNDLFACPTLVKYALHAVLGLRKYPFLWLDL